MKHTQFAVQDAELFLELELANLLGPVFQLPFAYATTNLLWDNLERPQQLALEPYRTAGRLEVVDLSFQDQLRAAQLEAQSNGLTLAECSVYQLAHTNNYPMLALCNSLCNRCYIPPVLLYNMPWLINQLVAQRCMSRVEAISMAKRLGRQNPRLRTQYSQLEVDLQN
jgi:hypothetical protein